MLYLRFVRDLASTTWLQAAVHRCVPGIRHSAICVIPGFRQVRISVIVPSSRKLGTRIFWNRPVPSRPVPEIRYARVEDARPPDQNFAGPNVCDSPTYYTQPTTVWFAFTV